MIMKCIRRSPFRLLLDTNNLNISFFCLQRRHCRKEVRAILLDIDSPGGEATGMFATAKLVSAVNKTKPVVAFVNDVAASAAYGIASAASEIIAVMYRSTIS